MIKDMFFKCFENKKTATKQLNSGVLTCVVTVQVRATDQGSPPRSSTARLDVEWMSRPLLPTEPIAFEEPHFTFAVMETEPVTHMVGIIMMESGGGPHWFDIIGESEGAHVHAHTHTHTNAHGWCFLVTLEFKKFIENCEIVAWFCYCRHIKGCFWLKAAGGR